MPTQVIFNHDINDVPPWTVRVVGVKDETEAMQAFNTLIITIREANIVAGYKHIVKAIDDQPEVYELTPTVFPFSSDGNV